MDMGYEYLANHCGVEGQCFSTIIRIDAMYWSEYMP
jgi:hypothetical protein